MFNYSLDFVLEDIPDITPDSALNSSPDSSTKSAIDNEPHPHSTPDSQWYHVFDRDPDIINTTPKHHHDTKYVM